MKQNYGPEAFQSDTGVSRETLDRLGIYVDLLTTWNKKINLIGRSTASDLWNRHLLDCAQLFPLLPPSQGPVLDLGSGAGLPGLVLAIMGAADVHLVESDQRKAAFLREAARMTAAPVTVHARRVEDISPFPARAVTARALAPLTDLLSWSAPFLTSNSVCLFLKGQNVEAELTEAHKTWSIGVEQMPSRSDPRGVIVCIDEVRRVQSELPDNSGPNKP